MLSDQSVQSVEQIIVLMMQIMENDSGMDMKHSYAVICLVYHSTRTICLILLERRQKMINLSTLIYMMVFFMATNCHN